jgi:hypothetical protein
VATWTNPSIWRLSLESQVEARPSLESQVEEMRRQGRSAAFIEAWVAGWSLATARAILKILNWRGIEVDEAYRERIETCAYPSVLERWLERSFTVATAGEVFYFKIPWPIPRIDGSALAETVGDDALAETAGDDVG